MARASEYKERRDELLLDYGDKAAISRNIAPFSFEMKIF